MVWPIFIFWPIMAGRRGIQDGKYNAHCKQKRALRCEECFLARSALEGGDGKSGLPALTAAQDESKSQQTGTEQHRAHRLGHYEAVGCTYQICRGVGGVHLNVIVDVEGR